MGMHSAKNAAPPAPPTQEETSTNGGRPASASASSSFFSRLGLPSLRSRTRNLADFHIRPADPHRKYWPGDHVNGAVILTIVKPIRIVHLTVTLYGFARVFRATGPTNEIVPSPSAINASPIKAFRYHGNGLLSLFQDEQVLSGEGRLEPGKYEFGFDLVFPPGKLPSSIDVGTRCPCLAMSRRSAVFTLWTS